MEEEKEFLQREKEGREEAERQGTEQVYKDAYEKILNEKISLQASDGTKARDGQEEQDLKVTEAEEGAEQSFNDAFFEGLDSITDSPFGELMNGVIYAAMETSRLTAAEIMPALEKALDSAIEASGYSTQMNAEAVGQDYLKEHLSANEQEAGTGAERTAGAGI